MNKTILFSFLSAGLTASAANAEVLQFDLGHYSQVTADSTWNNIPNTPSDNAPQDIAPGLVVSTVGATPYGVDASGFGTAQFHGVGGVAANWDGPYPAGITGPGAEGGPAGSDMALRDGTYARNGDMGSIVITGLTPGSSWNLHFYGGRGNNGADVDFSATSSNAGAASITNVFQNSTETCEINGIVINAAGNLTITQTTAGMVSGAWNALVMTSDGPGSTFCAGAGIVPVTPCPCGNDNDGSNGTAGCANGSNPGGAALTASGSPTVGSSSIVFTASGLQPGQPGLLFQADNAVNGGNGIAFGDGLRCAGGNIVRLGVTTSDGAGVVGSMPVTGSGLVVGDVRRYQYWYRNPGGSPCGSDFNLSNGYELTWQ